MSYINDKERMKKEAGEYRKKVWSVIKITFITFLSSLILFCAVFSVSLFLKRGDANDTIAPEILGPKSGRVVGYVGESPLYKQMVTVSDNADKDPQIDVNNSKVNPDVPGEYEVYFRAVDKAGNVSEIYTLIYVVKSNEYSRDTLMALIEEKAEDLGITREMTKKEQVRKIYSFVNSKKTIEFTNESNIPNIDRKNWETDWIEEAILTLDSGEGDCYSYYSLSKAFFEYFGIENEGIKRSERSKEEGTHFWHMVKIEEGWYYYDATSLAGEFADGSNKACLITQNKLDGYETSKGGKDFYLMDSKPLKISKRPLD